MLKGYKLLETNQKTASKRLHNYFICIAIFGGAFILYFISSTANLVYVENLDDFRSGYESNLDFYTIRTSGCTIPGMTALNNVTSKFVEYPTNFKYCGEERPPLVEKNRTHIWIEKHIIKSYLNDSISDEINCCASVITRPKSVEDIYSGNVDSRVEYTDCIPFDDYIEIETEFVQILCSQGVQMVYQDFFAFTPLKTPEVEPPNNTYNVLILGIDAVSRLNFHRTMPKTLKFLQGIDAIEFRGFNKVGDNTFPNLVPLLMGLPPDLKHICLPSDSYNFDSCPFIWNDFRDAGFLTAFGEDSSFLGTFNYVLTGFARNPTDYYLHTFINEAEDKIGNNKDWNSFLCYGFREAYKILLDYIEDLVVTLKGKPLFGFFWEVTMSHDHLNYPMLIDQDYEKFLTNLQNNEILDDTIVFLMSDHGIRWGNIRNTKQGRFEERLPFIFALLPKSFREKYGVAIRNMQTNSRRLITPYDLHETLVDLINTTKLGDDFIEERMKTPYSKNRGISLFLPVLENRTCESAHIDSHWCTCHQTKTVKNTKQLLEMGEYIVENMNNMLRVYPQCVPLELQEIVEASAHEISHSAVSDAEQKWTDYTLVISVKPSGGIFESTIRRSRHGTYQVTGTISRLNLYGSQSRCVDNYRMKLYCYCR